MNNSSCLHNHASAINILFYKSTNIGIFFLSFQDLEHCLLAVLHPTSSCKSLSPLFLKVNAEGLTGRQSTTPWSVLDSMMGAKTRVRGIQVDPWSVNTTESSSSRVLYRGEADVPTEAIMACTQGSVS